MLKIFSDEPRKALIKAAKNFTDTPVYLWLKPLEADEFIPILDDLSDYDPDSLRDKFEGENQFEALKAFPWSLVGKLKDKLTIAVTGWEGVGDENGEPLEFNEDNLKRFLRRAPLAILIEAGFKVISLTSSGTLEEGGNDETENFTATDSLN